MKDNQAGAKASFQLAYFPDFLHKETAQILQLAQRLAEAGEGSGQTGIVQVKVHGRTAGLHHIVYFAPGSI